MLLVTKLSRDITLIQLAIVAQPAHQNVLTGSKLRTRLELLHEVGPNHRLMQKVEVGVKHHQFKVENGIATRRGKTKEGNLPHVVPDQIYLEEI